jgi:hypothetical protein
MIPGILFDFGKTIVRGPGQKALARSVAALGHFDTHFLAIPRLDICTMRGLCAGRPLALKIRLTARASKAFAASP